MDNWKANPRLRVISRLTKGENLIYGLNQGLKQNEPSRATRYCRTSPDCRHNFSAVISTVSGPTGGLACRGILPNLLFTVLSCASQFSGDLALAAASEVFH